MSSVGFIGLGNLGMPIAANLAKAGHAVHAYDLSTARIKEAESHGIVPSSDAASAIADRDFIVTLLPMPDDVEKAATGPGGVIEIMRPDALYIEMSTIDPVCVRRIGEKFAARQLAMIDSPITRSVDMAWQGRSALLIGGDPANVERAMPLLAAVSDLQTVCGPLGNGAAMKLTNNFMAHGILGVISEALALGVKSGLALETIMQATQRSGTFNKLLLEVLPTRAFKGDFSAGFRSALALKDQRLALGLADALGTHAPIGQVVEQLFADIVAEDPDLDFTALLRRQELQDGFEARLDTVGE